MNVPAVQQPDFETIASELTVWHRWMNAYVRNENPLPELPHQEDQSTAIPVLCGIVVRCPLLTLGWLARKGGLSWLRQWAAAMRVRLDWLAACRVRCSLNRAFTELGLAALEAGNVEMAVECLRVSWRVHPCPHNTTFGLSPQLWGALAGMPRVEEARRQYEEIARRFAVGFGTPSKRLPVSEIARIFYRTVIRRERRAEHPAADDGRRRGSR